MEKELEEEDFFLCPDCAKDIYLKNYIQTRATEDQPCSICNTNNITYQAVNDLELRKFCRFLIRYNLPEYEYNSKWGGDNLPKRLFNENPILSHEYGNLDQRTDHLENLLENLFDLFTYPLSDLYYGYDEYGKGLYSQAIKEEASSKWEKYRKLLFEKNSFLIEDEAKDEFRDVFNRLSYTLPSKTKFYRARIGFKEERIKNEDFLIYEEIKAPYTKEDIGSPPIKNANEGRANRRGESMLYLAEKKETAISEVRAHPGHYVSIGAFKNTEELKIADLRFIDLMHFYKKNLEEFKFLRDLANDISKPVLPESSSDYIITQFISSVIRKLGFDGIMFNSSLSSGYNLVVFDSSKFKYQNKSAELFKIKKITYDIGKVIHETDSFVGTPIEKTL